MKTARARALFAAALVACLATAGIAAADGDPAAPAPAAPPQAAVPAPAPAPTWLAPAQPSSHAVGRQDSTRSPWSSFLLLVAVGGIGGGAYYIKRKKQVAALVPESGRLRVLESVRVSPRAQVVLTSVGGKLLLLGVTDRSVRRIAWVGRDGEAPRPARRPVEEKNERRELAPPAKPAASAPPRPFQAMLNALKGSAPPPAPAPSNAALELADEATDTYERSPANTNRASSRPPSVSPALRGIDALVAAAPSAAMLEGQVSGLRKRAVRGRKA